MLKEIYELKKEIRNNLSNEDLTRLNQDLINNLPPGTIVKLHQDDFFIKYEERKEDVLFGEYNNTDPIIESWLQFINTNIPTHLLYNIMPLSNTAFYLTFK